MPKKKKGSIKKKARKSLQAKSRKRFRKPKLRVVWPKATELSPVPSPTLQIKPKKNFFLRLLGF